MCVLVERRRQKNKLRKESDLACEGKSTTIIWALLLSITLGILRTENKLLSRWKYPFFFNRIYWNRTQTLTVLLKVPFHNFALQLSIINNLLPTTKTNSLEEVSNNAFFSLEKFRNELVNIRTLLPLHLSHSEDLASRST